jgi:GntR family transcriptional regulator
MTDDLVQPLRSNRLPLSAQAQAYLRNLIEGGTYQPGGQLPSENELAIQLGISRPTLREALRNLEQQGIIVRRHGVGTFVLPAAERLESGLERLESIHQLAGRQGLHIDVHDLQVRQMPADDKMARALEVPPGTLLTSVARVIAADDVPIAYLYDVATASVLSPVDVSEVFNGSVLDLLRNKAVVTIGQAAANIVAVNADAELARKLALKARQAVLLLEETLYDDKGGVIEYSRNYFNPLFFRFRVIRR